LELVRLAEEITVSLRSHFELERVKNSLSCLGSHPNFSGNPQHFHLSDIKKKHIKKLQIFSLLKVLSSFAPAIAHMTKTNE
jgi:hypothetical protein